MALSMEEISPYPFSRVVELSNEDFQKLLDHKVRTTTSYQSAEEWLAALRRGEVDRDHPSSGPLLVLTDS